VRALEDLIASGKPVTGKADGARVVLDQSHWRIMAEHLAGGIYALSGLWAEADMVHAALLDTNTARFAIVSLECPDGSFPALSVLHAPAIRLERMIFDLFGLVPEGAPDTRPWLDHGRWSVQHPLGASTAVAPRRQYDFLAAEGEGIHQIAVGPVHAGIIEPGHFRFSANGETVVRLEQRLGYTHKGIEALFRGAELDKAAKLSGRVSGDSTVAYSLAFARAVESALGVTVPQRAHVLRALMAELERLANHLGDIGAICNDAGFALLQAHCAVLRERVLRAAHTCFGHRLMRDVVVPGGVCADLTAPASRELTALLKEIWQRFPDLVELYDNTASLQDRTVGAGIVSPALVRQFAAGGYVGRASGRNFDVRRDFCHPPYDQLDFEIPVLADGDVNARVWIRIHEVEESLRLIDQILALPVEGGIETRVPSGGGEGFALVEGFRGDILAWVRLEGDGRVARCHLRDPSWFQWPLLEAAVEGNIVADFPLCNKSFNCSYSGHDL
jgi:Ni,Fe-hydrogenase III large subunit